MLLFISFRIFIKNWVLGKKGISTAAVYKIDALAGADGVAIWLLLVGANRCWLPMVYYQSERQQIMFAAVTVKMTNSLVRGVLSPTKG